MKGLPKKTGNISVQVQLYTIVGLGIGENRSPTEIIKLKIYLLNFLKCQDFGVSPFLFTLHSLPTLRRTGEEVNFYL